jgi:oligopeptide/dipeptide ABC transporter ATP-binding protein
MDPEHRLERPRIAGDPPNPIDPPPGCRFRTRCAFAMPRCADAAPPPIPVSDTQAVAYYLCNTEPASVA